MLKHHIGVTRRVFGDRVMDGKYTDKSPPKPPRCHSCARSIFVLMNEGDGQLRTQDPQARSLSKRGRLEEAAIEVLSWLEDAPFEWDSYRCGATGARVLLHVHDADPANI
jgi:hypothetical protein